MVLLLNKFLPHTAQNYGEENNFFEIQIHIYVCQEIRKLYNFFLGWSD